MILAMADAGDVVLAMAAFGGASSLVALVFVLAGPRSRQIETRLSDAARPGPQRTPPLVAAVEVLSRLGTRLMPSQKPKLERMRVRLLQAGFYRQHTSATFFAMRFLLLVLPIAVGLALSTADMLPLADGIEYGVLVGVVGTIVPGVWISQLRAGRQRQIRRALPDALDVIVICLEGGLSMPAAFARVNEELGAAYPLLAAEMSIVRKQMELGQSTAAAFREFSDRFDVEELRSLALLIGQAEKYGASLVRTLRIQADALRLKRYQWAEGQAQKAPLKLIFPTVLCMFPALYIVLMGPALVQVLQLLKSMGS
jgi:tight adherence protein C